MGVPKKKTSRSRRGTRRAHQSIKEINLSSCPECKHAITSHCVCANCGFYKGKQILTIKTKKAKDKKGAK